MSDQIGAKLSRLAALGRQLADEHDLKRAKATCARIAVEALRLSLDDSQAAAKKSLARQGRPSSSRRQTR